MRNRYGAWIGLLLLASVYSLGCNNSGDDGRAGLKQQVTALDSAQIWKELFPADHHFDEEGRVVRTVVRGTEEKELHTAVGKVFRYDEGRKHKAVVVLYSYDMDAPPDCHACFPEMDLASFLWHAGAWRKQTFVQNAPEAFGAWGEPADIRFDSSGGKKRLVLQGEYENQGKASMSRTYFDAETLKPLSSKSTN